MSLNESIVEDAALEWFGKLGYVTWRGPHLAPGEPEWSGIRSGEVVLAGLMREAIWRLNSAIPFCPLSTLRHTLLPKLLSEGIQISNHKY